MNRAMQRYYQWKPLKQWYWIIKYLAFYYFYFLIIIIFTILKAIKGAVAVVSAKDIPQNGKNDFMLGLGGDPEIVCSHTCTCTRIMYNV